MLLLLLSVSPLIHCLCFSLDCLIVSSSVTAVVAAAVGWSSAAANYRLPFSAGGVLVAD